MIASSTGSAIFSRGLMRPSDIGRRTSALNMLANFSVAVANTTSSSPSRK